MTKTWMLTVPRNNTAKEWVAISKWLRANDVHKWICAMETGADGYDHWQIRLQVNKTWEKLKEEWGPKAHIEEASDVWDYERKSGLFFSSQDTPEVRKCRFGHLTWRQKAVLRAVQSTNDRQVVVWYDPDGNKGKSWLLGHLYETGQAWVVQAQDTVKGIIQDVASEYINHGWRPMVVIDIPRTWRWTSDLYVAIERIKDGLIKDPRYSSKTVHIRGVKILVTCNTMPKLDKLSEDRWIIIDGDALERLRSAWRIGEGEHSLT
ncbi:Rep protein [Porcine stool-associated circular virus 7]|uniref:Rep protein n=1 Tax=Porcine stool-associated circular virus 7 TaxID=1537166 RepID=A0A076VEN7_9VIRU|nr:Rep protein [Porcine stool-associated circular virus 7]